MKSKLTIKKMEQEIKQKTCEELIDEKLKERIQEAKEILASKDPIKALNDWVLWWDKEIGKLGLSTGGPADFFVFSGPGGYIYYHYQDWFDGAVRVLDGEKYGVMEMIYELLTI